MKIENQPITATEKPRVVIPMSDLQKQADSLHDRLYATHDLYLRTGDYKYINQQAQLSVEYERALHQIKKRLQGRLDGPFGK